MTTTVSTTMTSRKLAQELADMYFNAPQGDKVTMIHLFGIRYAEKIEYCGSSIQKIVKLDGIGDSYATEVHKGIRLSQYVTAL